jgi:hypothetical protein
LDPIFVSKLGSIFISARIHVVAHRHRLLLPVVGTGDAVPSYGYSAEYSVNLRVGTKSIALRRHAGGLLGKSS